MITKFLCRFLKPTSSVVVQRCHESSCASALSVCGESGSSGGFKVTVMGAAGGIGQPLALLLKLNPLVRELALHDVSKITPGVAADLSHMDTQAKVTGYTGPDQLPCAMKGTNLVVVAAGVPRKPGMTRDDLFKTNASIILNMANCLATCAPQAIVCIITNPVNSMVPVACEVLKKAGKFDPNRVLGVTTLDLVRSSAFVGAINGVDPKQVYVPVIGAHAGATIVPLLSQSRPPLQLSDTAKIMQLTKRIQEAGTEVVKAKAGGGSATLSTAYASARLANSVLRGLNGESNVIEAAYIHTNIIPEVTYFATPLLLGRNGVEKNLGYGTLNDYEQQLVKNAIPLLNKNIQTGEKFVNKSSSPC